MLPRKLYKLIAVDGVKKQDLQPVPLMTQTKIGANTHHPWYRHVYNGIKMKQEESGKN